VWRDDKCKQKHLVESPKGRNHLEDLDIGARIILMWILKGTGYEDVD
jgi:hypothetical protein